MVHVAGSVATPGLYRLNAGSRVQDAIEAAGGPADGADVHALNLAELITDGQKIFVPAAGQPGVAAPAGPQPAGKLNLNTATQEQLEELPGIGPVLAERIVQFREREGGFQSVRQLLEIEGIGPKKFEGIEDLLTA